MCEIDMFCACSRVYSFILREDTVDQFYNTGFG